MDSREYSTREGHRARLKNYIADKNEDMLSDLQLIELLLFYGIPRKDTNPLARVLISEFKSLSGIIDAEIAQLTAIEGVGENTAILIKLVAQIIKRYSVSRERDVKVFNKPDLAAYYLQSYLKYQKEEEFHVLFMDSGFKLLKHEKMEKGVADQVNVYVRKICEKAILAGAVNVLVAHNHPSGIAKPSESDDRITKLIGDALATLGMKLVDHLIITDSGSYSYFQWGGRPSSPGLD